MTPCDIMVLLHHYATVDADWPLGQTTAYRIAIRPLR